MTTHIMVDIETAATSQDAAILQLGAYVFYSDIVDLIHKKLKVGISVDDNHHYNRRFSRETLDWWDKQDRTLRNEVFSGGNTLQYALTEFSWILRSLGNDYCLWANGADFDFPIIKHAYEESLRITYPFDFRKQRCFRTLKSLRPDDVPPKPTKAHDALVDAVYQGDWARQILSNLGALK